jgi:1-acyl-sn-glycerol-3-phosphate acyltransferase
LCYRFVRRLFRIVALPMFHFRVEDARLVPRDGPGVVVAPHRSWLDPPAIGAACPRPVRFLILDSVYRRPGGAWFYRLMNSIPVRGSRGAQSVVALRRALRALRDGQLIGVFPEGRVVPDGPLGPWQAGAGLLAARAQAPVIPVTVGGSAQAWPHGRSWPRPAPVHVRFGEPVPPPSATDRAAVEAFLEEIRCRLERLVEETGEA